MHHFGTLFAWAIPAPFRELLASWMPPRFALIEAKPRPFYFGVIFERPIAERRDRVQKRTAEFRQGIIHTRRDCRKNSARYKPVPFQSPECERKHSL